MDTAASSCMTALIEAGDIDTVYRDVYLDRARTFLAPVPSLADFHRLEQERALKRAIADKVGLLPTGRTLYDVRDTVRRRAACAHGRMVTT